MNANIQSQLTHTLFIDVIKVYNEDFKITSHKKFFIIAKSSFLQNVSFFLIVPEN